MLSFLSNQSSNIAFKTYRRFCNVYGYSFTLGLSGFIPSKFYFPLIGDQDKLFDLLQLSVKSTSTLEVFSTSKNSTSSAYY